MILFKQTAGGGALGKGVGVGGGGGGGVGAEEMKIRNTLTTAASAYMLLRELSNGGSLKGDTVHWDVRM